MSFTPQLIEGRLLLFLLDVMTDANNTLFPSFKHHIHSPWGQRVAA